MDAALNDPRRLRIGLSPRILHRPPPELGFRNKTLQYLEQSIAHWIMRRGALVFMVPTLGSGNPLARPEIHIRDYVAALDGLVLQGGADVAPESYGQQALRPEWAGDRVRDLFEIDLLWESISRGKPVLGICRGAQLINVALGGTLYQDLATQRPDAAPHIDRELYDAHHHGIQVLAGSRLATHFTPTRPHLVSSIHHQAVRELGRDLAVEAVSVADGIVEALRMNGPGFVMGMQWHPEFHPEGGGWLDSGPILAEFLAAAAAAAEVARA